MTKTDVPRQAGGATRVVRLMIADDHETIREGFRALFASAPEVDIVEEVGDTDAALLRIRTLTLDVVVMDLSIPRIGGLAAIRLIKQERDGLAVVIFTRHGDPAFVREALSAGASAYVLQQSSFAELRAAVSAVMRGERYVDPRLNVALDTASSGTAASLSRRERDVLQRTARGQSNKEIAAALGISIRTVEVHKTHGMRKLGLRDRSDLVRYSTIHGWLSEP